MIKKIKYMCLGIAMAWGATVTAADTQSGIDTIKEAFPGLAGSEIRPTPVDGWFEILLGGQVVYVSADAKYVMRGDLIELSTNFNYTDARLDEARVDVLATVDNDDAIVFKPENVKHKLTVFTDIDCGYCRKLHSEIADLEALGVEVRYLFFPRAGPGSASWDKAESVWCADDRNSALTEAKAGAPIKPNACGDESIKAQYEMGRAVGLTGTPAIITESGELIAGYLPAERLVSRIEASIKGAGQAQQVGGGK